MGRATVQQGPTGSIVPPVITTITAPHFSIKSFRVKNCVGGGVLSLGVAHLVFRELCYPIQRSLAFFGEAERLRELAKLNIGTSAE